MWGWEWWMASHRRNNLKFSFEISSGGATAPAHSQANYNSCASHWNGNFFSFVLSFFRSISRPFFRIRMGLLIFVAKHSNPLWCCLNSYRNALAMACVVVHIFVPTFHCTLHMVYFHYKVVLCSQQTSFCSALAMQTCWQKTFGEMVNSHSDAMMMSSSLLHRRCTSMKFTSILLVFCVAIPFALHFEISRKRFVPPPSFYVAN